MDQGGSKTNAEQPGETILPAQTPANSGLIVDCGFGKGEKTCEIRHLFDLANRIIKLLLWVAVTGAGIVIFWKGVKLATNIFWPGGYNTARDDFQKSMKGVLTGLFFILSAYLIVKAGFDIVGYQLNDGKPFVLDSTTSGPVR